MSNEQTSDPSLLDAWFIETKLKPPQSGIKLIDRTELLNRFSGIVDRGSVCITAPAGFGKSSLLAQWRERFEGPDNKIAWLSLDEDDAELRQFASYVIFALIQAGVDMGRLQVAAEQVLADMPTKSILPSLINTLSRCPANVVLILDDFHRVESAEVNRFVEDLISFGPAHLKVFVCSRSQPEINTVSLIAHGRLRELGADELRFSMEETERVFENAVSAKHIEYLHDRTEGWPVALQLARLSIQKKATQKSDIAVDYDEDINVSAHSSHIADYFAQQVLEQQPEELQNFLLMTSVLERFDASLADAVCESKNSRIMMQETMSLHPLLIPLDETERWFRYHHMFSEFLSHRLSMQTKVDVKALNLRASKWFEEQGQIPEAIRHARVAQDFDRCARLIQDAGGWELILYGGIGYIRTLLRYVTESDLIKFPRLRLARAYLCMKDGLIAESVMHMDLAACAEGELDDPGYVRDRTMLMALLNSYTGGTHTAEIYHRLKQDLEHWSPQDHLGRGVLMCACAIADMGQGNFDDARDLVVRAVKSMRMANSILGINYCYVHLGHVAFLKGQFQMAKAHYAEATSMAEDNFGSDSGLKSVCDIGRSVLAVWQDGRCDEALNFDKALTTACEGDGWFEIYAAGFSAKIAQAYLAGDASVAERVARQAQQLAQVRNIDGLNILSDVYALHAAILSKNNSEGARLKERLSHLQSISSWSDEGVLWRSGSEVTIALGMLTLSTNARGYDMAQLDAVIDHLDTIGAGFASLRCLVLKAALLQHTGHLDAACDTMFRAANLAVKEGVYTPFLLHTAVRRLVRQTVKIGRERPDQQLELNFLNECVQRFPKATGANNGITLSARESEVLYELSLGKTNKEIARSLDMTHHTVKFHLKNVFSKLGVDNRIHALNHARHQNLLDTDRV